MENTELIKRQTRGYIKNAIEDAGCREIGDYIIINDNNDRKLLNDYLKNEQIPLDKRDSIPVVADGNHVLWVVGYRISAAAKVSDSTSKILVLQYNDKEK